MGPDEVELTDPDGNRLRVGQVAPVTGRGVAVVTGASSGIGAATARAAGRRRLATSWSAPAAPTASRRWPTDDRRARAPARRDRPGVGRRLRAPPCPSAGCSSTTPAGPWGSAPVAEADEDQWRTMYDTNVLGVVRMIRGLLPVLEASGDGQVVTIGSIAGHEPYPGGAGYNAAKFAVRAVMPACCARSCSAGRCG